MEEKMEGLNKIFDGVKDYCEENSIEYLFAATAENGKYVKISNNSIANSVLKEAAKIVQTLIKK
jgi:hypothetical protein